MRPGEPSDLQQRLEHVLRPEELAKLLAAQHKPLYAAQVLSRIVRLARLQPSQCAMIDHNLTQASYEEDWGPCPLASSSHVPRPRGSQGNRWLAAPPPSTAGPVAASAGGRRNSNSLARSFPQFHDLVGGMERILKTPIYLPYSRNTSRFLVIYLLFLPFGEPSC